MSLAARVCLEPVYIAGRYLKLQRCAPLTVAQVRFMDLGVFNHAAAAIYEGVQQRSSDFDHRQF